MTIFNSELDLRGRTVRLRGRGEDDDPITITIPQGCCRRHHDYYITYTWRLAGPGNPEKWVFQNTRKGIAGAFSDIVEVLPKPAENGAAPAEESLRSNGNVKVEDPKSAYLGDGAYVTHLSGPVLSGDRLAVKANDHLNPTDSVVLGPNELIALIRFAQERGILPEQVNMHNWKETP